MIPLVDVAVESEGWKALDDLQGLAERAIGAAIAQEGLALSPQAEVSLMFCGDAFIQALNLRWRGFDKPTNVLSFPTAGELETARALGDVVVAFETCAREAREAGKPLSDHVSHLIVHGFLHLVGYDHEDVEEAEEMEAAERAALARLGVDDPYREPAAPHKER
ncbi:rRNA maturation RNase YbeY [Methylocella sp.]|uniref:rRNA maturation RNase YbeY n=1 Tax=Methylocella sp. TaxID=1978226 RepID=UPI0037842FD2